MEKGTKIALIVGSAIAFIGGGAGLFFWLKKSKDEREENKETEKGNDASKDIEKPELVIGKKVVAEKPVNLRYENYVDNAFPTNLIKSDFKGTIGTLEKVSKADQQYDKNDLFDWYYVKLDEPIEVGYTDMVSLQCGTGGKGTHTHCWVRSDNVKIK